MGLKKSLFIAIAASVCLSFCLSAKRVCANNGTHNGPAPTLQTVLAGPCAQEKRAFDIATGSIDPQTGKPLDSPVFNMGAKTQEAAKALVSCERKEGVTPPSGLLHLAGQN